jgi:hypothetical protein
VLERLREMVVALQSGPSEPEASET